MPRLVARVLVAADGAHGNEVAVALGDDLPPAADRQCLAASAAEPATVFVAADRRTVRIHNRKLERRFAGHPLLGTAAVLRSAGLAPTALLTAAGEVPLWSGDGLEWLSAPSEGKPEDEACGSASMLLATNLGRPLEVLHGRGSTLHVHPGPTTATLGGRVVVR